LITIQREGLRSFTRAIGALALSTVLVAQTAYAGTYMPECYKAATDNPGNLKYPAKKGPYRIALVNGYTGIPWREQMIKSVRVWAARPDIASQGVVTLPNREREVSVPQELSGRCHCGPPRGHRVSAKRTGRLG
jgi:hypothetical protein